MWVNSLIYGLFTVNLVLKFLLKISTYSKLIKCSQCGFITWVEVLWIPRAPDTSVFKCKCKNFWKEHYRAKYKSSLDHVPIHLLHELSPSDSPEDVLKHFMRLGMLVPAPFTDEKTSTGRINDLPIEMQLKHNREGLRFHLLDQTWTQASCLLSFWLHFCTIAPVISTVLHT